MKLQHPSRGMRTIFTIWSGQLISLVGSQLTGFALGVWTYDMTHSVLSLALRIPPRSIFPFLGLDDADKTTTIKQWLRNSLLMVRYGPGCAGRLNLAGSRPWVAAIVLLRLGCLAYLGRSIYACLAATQDTWQEQ